MPGDPHQAIWWRTQPWYPRRESPPFFQSLLPGLNWSAWTLWGWSGISLLQAVSILDLKERISQLTLPYNNLPLRFNYQNKSEFSFLLSSISNQSINLYNLIVSICINFKNAFHTPKIWYLGYLLVLRKGSPLIFLLKYTQGAELCQAQSSLS